MLRLCLCIVELLFQGLDPVLQLLVASEHLRVLLPQILHLLLHVGQLFLLVGIPGAPDSVGIIGQLPSVVVWLLHRHRHLLLLLVRARIIPLIILPLIVVGLLLLLLLLRVIPLLLLLLLLVVILILSVLNLLLLILPIGCRLLLRLLLLPLPLGLRALLVDVQHALLHHLEHTVVVATVAHYYLGLLRFLMLMRR